jgi:hypothetical protein
LFERVERDARIQDCFAKLGTCSGVNQEAVERYIGRVVKF